jgi:transcriptional regulator of arginine metabolism
MSKKTRQQAVIDIVSRQRVPSQAALAEELKKLDFEVTQATLSRDIAELNLVKSKDGYLRPEDASGIGQPSTPDLVSSLRRGVIKIEASQNLVVVRTPPTGAQQVGLALDELGLDKIIGNVAGYDTVLVVTRNHEDAVALKQAVIDMID